MFSLALPKALTSNAFFVWESLPVAIRDAEATSCSFFESETISLRDTCSTLKRPWI